MRKRSPRFRRVATKTVSFTAADLEILKHVHRFRLAQTPHIVSLTGRGERAIQRRLRLLYHHRYLDRIPPTSFNDPIIHALGNRGADEISRHLGKRRNRVDWLGKNRALQRGFIDHTLMVTETMSWMAQQCRRHTDLELLEAKGKSESSKREVSAAALFRGSWYTLRVTPDWIFSLSIGGGEGKSEKLLYLECDRGTMPVSATSLRRSSIEKKMSVYLAAIRNGYHEDAFGQSNARVLWVVDTRYSGEKRLESLLEMNRRLTQGRGSRAFLFLLRQDLRHTNYLALAPIVDGRGEEAVLFG